MKKTIKPQSKLIALAAVTIATAMLASGCSYLFPVEEAPLAPPIVSPSLVEYTTTTVKRGTIEKTLVGTAYVQSTMNYKMSFTKHGGYLTKLNNKIGTHVNKGDILAELDTVSLRKELETAKISLEKAKVSRDALVTTDVEPTDLEIRKAKLNIEDQEIEIKELAKKHSQGYAGTAAENKREMERAELVLKELQEALQKLLNPTDKTMRDIKLAELDIKEAQGIVDRLTVDLNESILVAPIAGEIMETEENFAVGSPIEINQTICTIADISTPELVTGDITGLEISSEVRPKALVTINGNKYAATVSLNIQKDENGEAKSNQDASKKYKLTFDEVPNGKNFVEAAADSDEKIIEWDYGKIMTYGASFQFKIIVEKKENVLYLPLTAVKIINDGNGKTATVTTLNDKIKEEVSVAVGMKTDSLIEIVSGIEEGVEVVIR